MRYRSPKLDSYVLDRAPNPFRNLLVLRQEAERYHMTIDDLTAFLCIASGFDRKMDITILGSQKLETCIRKLRQAKLVKGEPGPGNFRLYKLTRIGEELREKLLTKVA